MTNDFLQLVVKDVQIDALLWAHSWSAPAAWWWSSMASPGPCAMSARPSLRWRSRASPSTNLRNRDQSGAAHCQPSSPASYRLPLQQQDPERAVSQVHKPISWPNWAVK